SIVAQELDVDRFVTLVLATVDVTTWEVRLVLAGHPPPLIIRSAAVGFIDSPPAPPLGVSAVNSAPPPTTAHLDPGDALVLYTDGVTEAVDLDGVRYGADRLRTEAQRIIASG